MFKDKNSLYAPVLVLLLVVASFFIGRLSSQVEGMKSGTAKVADTKQAGDVAAETGSKIDVPALKVMAKGLGVDSSKFDKCLDDGTNAKKVADQAKEGQGLGVSGTPSFLVNGLLIVGSLAQTEFEKVIDAELKDGSGAVAATAIAGEKVTRQTVPYGVGYIKGSKDAKIKIMEYTDFECPYCNKAFPIIESLLAKYGDKISLEYRSFPLGFHADAQKAAEAALCAGEQGKFWEMHDKMFTVMAGE